ncbi:MAG: cytochrome c3 family protein [Acidobacteria bacterium]|nr:cytochrome c3 family protein [Acidobacteriota bacterium]
MRGRAARVVSAAAILAIGLATPAGAGVVGTAHEIGDEKGGVCAVCHLPHKAGGEKLWPTDMSGRNRYGAIGALCYYCHGPGDAGGSGIVSANLGNVWDEHSHGREIARSPDGAAAVDATLPYVTAAAGGFFECTTCHNVHDDTHKPFLWDTIDRLCLRCHPRRNFVGGAESVDVGEWGKLSGAGNPGSHPVGTDVFGSRREAAPVDPTFGALGILPWDGGVPGTHNLGPHLTGGGAAPGAGAGIGCNTCHAVHGRYPEGGAETPPSEDLLAVAQGGDASGHANGGGEAASALCESCHRGPQPPGYAGAAWPNPGGLPYTHPVDDLDSSRDLAVSVLPAGWPSGVNATTVMRPNLVCGSCHLPHPRAAFIAQPEAPPRGDGIGTPLLRDETTAICFDCHTNGFSPHHPTGAGLMGGGFGDPFIGNQDADLTCDDCHVSGGAHNWPAKALPGLDPDWRPKDSSLTAGQPSDNGRIQEEKGVRFVEERSLECFRCHTASGARFTPTRGKEGGRRGNAQYQALGDGSHFLGKTKLDFSQGSRNRAPWNAKTSPWTGGGYSRFGGTAEEPVMVCEACHDLRMATAVPGSALLLEPYVDGAPVDVNPLCEGCHGKGSNKGGNHPMTGDTVSFAIDAGRSQATLKTGGGEFRVPENIEGTGANTPGAPTGPATYPRADAMNCDSCHQTHDAAAATVILEIKPAAIRQVGPLQTITLYGQWEVPDAEGTTFDYQSLCVQCHTK